ncbi:MAG: GHKL domain-containing protein [Bacteroidetes bacterium]|nr:MAG: GHKL domain-containing protein [Bacteroidota bacterium]
MSDSYNTDGKMRFSVDSSLLFQLGEQLVAKSSVALAELVKNAYDADATQVTVTLENVGRPGGTIIVEDNGHGMTFEEIQNGWMRIATTNKKSRSVSRIYKRPLTGAKGIGRFAARRLGSELFLHSVAYREDNVKEAIGIQFNWDDFLSGSDITEIPVTYRRLQASPDEKTGVKLHIYNARDAWTEEEIIALKRDLLTIQSPFPDMVHLEAELEESPDPGFNFSLDIVDTDQLEQLSGNLGDEFLNLHWACIEGNIDENGIAHYEIKIRQSGEADQFQDDVEKYLDELAYVRFRFYYFVEGTGGFASSTLSTRDFRKKAKDESGVRIYLDGFRVFPYGQEGDDWLGNDYYASQNIDMANYINMSESIKAFDKLIRSESSNPKERPYLLIPRNRMLFGAVFLSRMLHPDIEITASREGFIENEYFEGVRRFLQRGVYWLTLKYAAATIQRRAARREERKNNPKPAVNERIEIVRQEMQDFAETLKPIISAPTVKTTPIFDPTEAKENLDKSPSPVETSPPIPDTSLDTFTSEAVVEIVEENVRKWEEELKDIGQQQTEEQQDHISDIAMLRLLASAGTTLMLMQHQLRAVIDGIGDIANDLRRLIPRTPPDIAHHYEEITTQIEEWHRLVYSMVQQLGFLLSPDNRQRRKRHALYEIVEDVRRPMSYYMAKYNVIFENNVSLELRTPSIYQAELYAILINIFSNALKAVYNHADRHIAVEAFRENDLLHIIMVNTGNRVPDNMRDKYFLPFETSSAPNPVLGVGTGLGLTVVRDTVESYKGEVHFIDVNEPWQTGIEIIFPYNTEK